MHWVNLGRPSANASSKGSDEQQNPAWHLSRSKSPQLNVDQGAQILLRPGRTCTRRSLAWSHRSGPPIKERSVIGVAGFKRSLANGNDPHQRHLMEINIEGHVVANVRNEAPMRGQRMVATAVVAMRTTLTSAPET